MSNVLKLTAHQRAQIAASNRAGFNPLNLIKSDIPATGWNSRTFTPARRLRLQRDMVRIARLEKSEGVKELMAPLNRVMVRHVNEVIRRGEDLAEQRGFRKSAKMDVTINVQSHGRLWAEAINDGLQEAHSDILTVVGGPVGAIGESTSDRVGLLLSSSEPTDQQRQLLHSRLDEVAEMVTSIDSTTRSRLRAIVRKSLDDGDSPFELAEKIRQKIPTLASNRVPTIARTEIGRAVDSGTKLAMVASGVVTHFSVIGCEAIEPNSPTWNGIHTCNIQNVPIENEREIKFHPNHTGTIVVSGMIDFNDVVPDLETVTGGPDSEFVPAPGISPFTPSHASSPELIPLGLDPIPQFPPFLVPRNVSQVQQVVDWAAQHTGLSNPINIQRNVRFAVNAGVDFDQAKNNQGLTFEQVTALLRFTS